MLSIVTNSTNVSPPPTNRPRLTAAMARRRQKILDVAVDLFSERGYLGTTVDDIAAGAGITKRTLYHHMANKESILAEIHSAFIQAGLQRWEAVVSEGGSPTEVLRRLIEEHVRIVAAHRKAIAVFFEDAKHLNEKSRSEINAQRDRYEAILYTTISEGVGTGEFRSDLNVRVVTLLILGGLTEMYRWFKPKSNAAQDTLITMVTDLALDGVLNRSRAA
jgi:TetR/AcrR family transcriptional regulator, cholesterol catabolism regulator